MQKVFSWKDGTTWPDNWPGCEIEPNSSRAYELASQLRRQYDCFVAYHACRPIDTTSYYQNGLRLADHTALLNDALRIFGDGNFSEISREDVVESARAMPSSSNARLYVALDDRHIVSWCGHYLLYGSEYITGIAAGLTRLNGFDYRQHLKSSGRPTMFELHLPLSWIGGDCLAELSSVMARRVLFDEIAYEEDFTMTLHRPVPPEFIISHYHPPIIRDPLTRGIYRDE